MLIDAYISILLMTLIRVGCEIKCNKCKLFRQNPKIRFLSNCTEDSRTLCLKHYMPDALYD